ncbi:hypothetical protein [Methylocella silvestris]|uniref:hypothetical protein n=1 Tax=Methylocella silvestris TaxID=199596 RepID=UPI0015E0E491|nr:hypothetical protein [Methylocella silvestris]
MLFFMISSSEPAQATLDSDAIAKPANAARQGKHSRKFISSSQGVTKSLALFYQSGPSASLPSIRTTGTVAKSNMGDRAGFPEKSGKYSRFRIGAAVVAGAALSSTRRKQKWVSSTPERNGSDSRRRLKINVNPQWTQPKQIRFIPDIEGLFSFFKASIIGRNDI